MPSWPDTCKLTASLSRNAIACFQAFGNAAYWRVPTPSETAYQAYVSAAFGTHPMAFCYDTNGGTEQRIALGQPAMESQLEALGVAYRKLAKWSPILDAATGRTVTETAGNVVAEIVSGGKRYVMVVAAPSGSYTATVRGYVALDVDGGWPVFGWGRVSLLVSAGDGRVWRVF